MASQFSGEKFPVLKKPDAEINQKKPSGLLSIGQIAKLCGISTKTLRHYDKTGIFKPEYLDPQTGYRYYRKEQLFWLVMIKRLKYRTFSLDEISVFINSNRTADTKKLFLQKENEIDEKISELLTAKKLLHSKLEFLNKVSLLEQNGLLNKEELFLKDLPPRPVIFIRKKEIFSVETMSERLSRIQLIREKRKLHITGLGMAIFHDDYFKCIVNEVDFEIASELEEYNEKTDATIRFIPEGKYACFYHRGSRENSIQMYEKMTALLKRNNHHIDGPLIKIYMVSFAHTKSKDNIVSEFQIKVK